MFQIEGFTAFLISLQPGEISSSLQFMGQVLRHSEYTLLRRGHWSRRESQAVDSRAAALSRVPPNQGERPFFDL